MEYGDIIPMAAGFVPYVLELPASDDVEDGSVLAIALVCLKRDSGLLLALPKEFLHEDILEMGNLAGPDDMLGPSKVIEVPGGLLMDPTMQDPPEPEEGTEVSVVLIDALAEVAAHLKVMVPAQHDPASMYTFLSTRPDIYPCKPQLLEKVAEWISNPEAGERVNFYSAAEEETVANGQGAGFMEPSAKQRAGPGIGSAKAAPQVTRVKRPTVASLATSVNELVSALPAINQQLLLLQQKQDAMEASSTRAAALRQPLGGAASTGLLDASAQISTMLQEMPPPRTAAPRMPQRPSSMLGGLQQQEVSELEAEKLEKPDHPSNDVAKAVLAQSNALTALVGQIASMGGDSLSDLTSSSSGLSSKGSVGRQKLHL